MQVKVILVFVNLDANGLHEALPRWIYIEGDYNLFY